MTFTKEQLIARINQVTAINKYRISRDSEADGLAMDNELFAIALASLEAKPIGAFHIADQQVDGTTDYIKDGEWPIDDGVIEVYAAPPAPVSVPDDVLKGLLPDAEKAEFWFEHNGKILFEGVKFNNAVFDACRAAMLQGAEPVTTAYKLRDAVETIRNSGIEIDAEKILAERDDLDSPVIPDGWVAVPVEPTHEMLEAGDEQFGTYDVYRRMIAAAPQQEA